MALAGVWKHECLVGAIARNKSPISSFHRLQPKRGTRWSIAPENESPRDISAAIRETGGRRPRLNPPLRIQLSVVFSASEGMENKRNRKRLIKESIMFQFKSS